MGTTRDAIRAGNPELAYVLCIEGHKYLISDFANESAVTTAWASTLWSNALPGLQVTGELEQSFRPFSNEPSVPSLTFSIVGDNGTDQFATDVFKTQASNRTELRVSFDNGISDGGGFDIDVKDASIFPADDPVFIGTKAYKVSGSTPAGNLIPIAVNGEGYFAPFSGDNGATNRFPGAATAASDTSVNTFDTNAPVWVSDAPTTWVGKKVGLWIHLVRNGVLDVKSEAELVFAGSIKAVNDGEMATHLQCSGIQQDIIDSEILRDQWVGRIKEGYVFDGDEEFKVTYIDHATPQQYDSATFTTTGRLSAEELAAEISVFLDSDTTVGVGSTPDLRWEFKRTDTEAGPRMSLIAVRDGSTVDIEGQIILSCNNSALLRFLGWSNFSEQDTDGRTVIAGRYSDGYTWEIVSDDAPFKYPMLGLIGGSVTNNVTQIELEDSDGTFFDQTDLLPSKFQSLIVSGDVWGLFSIGDSVMFLGKRASATSITGISFDLGFPSIGLTPDENMQGLRVGDGQTLSVKQCLFITGSFSDIIAKLFASTDGNGVNHTSHDVFPFGAGIPWDLLGSGFVQSLANIEQSGAEEAMSIIVEKPMKLWDVIKSDFTLRMATPIWKDGGIQIVQLAVPNALTADHVLDETNKGDASRTVSKLTSAWQVHTLKILHNRNPLKDKYSGQPRIIRDLAGYQDHGSTGQTKTLKARNSYDGVSGTGASVEALGDLLAHRFMPVLSKPLGVYTRTINHQLFHMAPMDTVSLSDDSVRNGTSGKRGVSGRACTVIGVTTSFGFSSGGGQDMHGSVELLYTEERRTYPTAPSCEHARVTSGSFTNGYDSADDLILVHQNKFTLTGTGSDSDGFAAGDVIRITEMDPANPAAASTFTDTVVTVAPEAVAGYDSIRLTTGITPVAGATYLINYDSYDQVTASQQLKAFQADGADGAIQDLAEPNTLGDTIISGTIPAADSSILPSRHSSEQYGDGVPMSASLVRGIARMANNLTDYKTAPHMPVVNTGSVIVATGVTDFHHRKTFPFPIGPSSAGRVSRLINAAVQFASTTGASAVVRITSSVLPPKVDTNAFGFPTSSWGRTRRGSIEFTTTSTTKFTVSSTKTIQPAPSFDAAGFTWITIEANGFVDLAGIPEFWLGPKS